MPKELITARTHKRLQKMNAAPAKALGLQQALSAARKNLAQSQKHRLKASLMLTTQIDQLLTLNHLNRLTASAKDLKQTLDRVVRWISTGVGFERVVLYLIDPAKGRLIRAAGTANVSRKDLRGVRISFSDRTHVFGKVVAERKPYFLAEAESHPILNKEVRSIFHPKSLFCVPLIVRDQTIGVVQVDNPKSSLPLDKAKRALLVLVADQTALAIENAQLHEDTQQMNQQLKQLNEIKSRFVSILSHEVRNPLAAIHEGIALVSDEVLGPVNRKQRDFLTGALKNIKRLARMTTDLLDLSKMESGRMRLHQDWIRLDEVARDAVTTFKMQVRQRDIALRLESRETLPQIWADPDKLAMVFTNLISNAIKFTPKGGKVSVVLERERKWIKVFVKDTASAIPKSEAKRIFDQYHRIDTKTGFRVAGTGLGLPIAREIVVLHGGRLWLGHADKRGNTFVFTLPQSSPSKNKKISKG